MMESTRSQRRSIPGRVFDLIIATGFAISGVLRGMGGTSAEFRWDWSVFSPSLEILMIPFGLCLPPANSYLYIGVYMYIR